MNKDWYRSKIREIAEKNGGRAPGARYFYSETGTRESDWRRKLWNEWNNWGDVLEEFGFERGVFVTAIEKATILRVLAEFIQSFDPPRFPIQDELIRARRRGLALPGDNTIRRQIGERDAVIRALTEFCQGKEQYQAALHVCQNMSASNQDPITDALDEPTENVDSGWVYLIRAQGAYKIGCSRAPYRRAAEIANQSASGAELLHKIETDDPEGIERYWHQRFSEKRLSGLNKVSGEWFALNAGDTKAFKRRKNFM